MKKLYIAIGCLALMQTSAFSLEFKIGESIKETATVEVSERIEEVFRADLSPKETETYKPNKYGEKVFVTWTVGNKQVKCEPIKQDKPLEENYKAIMLIYSPMKGEHRCLLTPIIR